jgi:homoserine trans-succinylase
MFHEPNKAKFENQFGKVVVKTNLRICIQTLNTDNFFFKNAVGESLTR